MGSYQFKVKPENYGLALPQLMGNLLHTSTTVARKVGIVARMICITKQVLPIF